MKHENLNKSHYLCLEANLVVPLCNKYATKGAG